MTKVSRAIFWMLFGIWAAALVVIGIEAKREEGGSMPLALPFGVAWLIGGLVGFLLLHILLRKLWPDDGGERK